MEWTKLLNLLSTTPACVKVTNGVIEEAEMPYIEGELYDDEYVVSIGDYSDIYFDNRQFNTLCEDSGWCCVPMEADQQITASILKNYLSDFENYTVLVDEVFFDGGDVVLILAYIIDED